MNLRDFVPASTLAQKYGVKIIGYGPPGGGKTPLMKTAPSACLLVTEPGMMTMRDAHNIPAYPAFTFDRIDQFKQMVIHNSNEIRQFDTICIDSISQLAEIAVQHYMKKFSHGLKAYGAMSEFCMEFFDALYFMPQKHVYLVCKETTVEVEGAMMRKPYFPGNDLNVKVPHRYDEVLHIGGHVIPGVAGLTPSIRTKQDFNTFARDRSGKLAEFEPMDLTALINKAMA